MDHYTCKFYNGDFHNSHCLAGVAYRDVLTDPDRNEGSAFRKPCIAWDAWHKSQGKDFDNDAQRQEWALRGSCDKWEALTQAEIDADLTYYEERFAEVAASLAKGIVPEGVLVCGPSTIGKCKCNCPDSCEHVFDGPVVMMDEEDPPTMETATCSRCGMWAVNHDMWL